MGVSEIPPYTRAVPPPRPAPDPAAIEAAVDLIAAANRPLVITGGGTILSGAGPEVAELSLRFGLPLQTTPAGRGSVAETHPLFCGLTGLYRTTFPRRVYEAADLLITVGARMEEFQGGFLPLPQDPEVIQIDIESFELGRNWKPDVAIQADARQAIAALIDGLTQRGVPAKDAIRRRDHRGTRTGDCRRGRGRNGRSGERRNATEGEVDRPRDQSRLR